MFEQTQEYIEENVNLIDDGNWDILYSNCASAITGDLTQALNEAEIHPELELKVIPEYFCYAREDILTYDINPECTKIDDCAFYNAEKLEQISLPDSIDYIGETVFANCNLRKIKLPKNLKVLHKNTFSWNYNLEEVIIDRNIQKISIHPFYECISLSSVKYLGTIDEFNNITKDISWADIRGKMKSIHQVECIDGIWEANKKY